MKPVRAHSADLWPMVEPTPEFQIAIISDGHAQGLQAMRVCSALITQFNDDLLFQVAVCPLSTFTGSGVETAAQRQTERADLIILAISTPPPPALWNWLDAWACGRLTRPPAIRAFIRDDAAELEGSLKRWCRFRAVELTIEKSGREGEKADSAARIGQSLDEDTQLATSVRNMEKTNSVQDAVSPPKL